MPEITENVSKNVYKCDSLPHQVTNVILCSHFFRALSGKAVRRPSGVGVV